MKKINIIDVTLRDGGCVNDFNFGIDDMNSILDSLNKSGVGYIELGYIDEKKGSDCGRTQFSNERVIYENFLKEKVHGVKYLAMFDYGTFDVGKLGDCSKQGIDGLRLAFHKENAQDILDIGKAVIDKGYDFFIQPMLMLRYSDKDFLELIDMVNRHLPDAAGFYVVDSFGEMRHNDVERALHLVDNNLVKEMPYGFHSHNNLQLSYANAISAIQFPSDREIFIDSSIMGMGKGAGNLNSELLLEHLSIYYGGQYDISPLLHVMDTVLYRIKAEYNWGYSAEYYLSSINHCSPSYARHFHHKYMLPANQLSELLGSIADDKKISFDKDYAEVLYHDYISYNVDDSAAIKELTEAFNGKKALLIAPGLSSDTEADKIAGFIDDNAAVTVSINTVHPGICSDYVFIANRRRYEALEKRIGDKGFPPLICASNVRAADNARVYTVNYSNYICNEPEIESNAGMMAVNLLCKLGISEIVLAGFDGFGINAHRRDALPEPRTSAENDRMNELICKHINKISETVKVTFLTKSIYKRMLLPESR